MAVAVAVVISGQEVNMWSGRRVTLRICVLFAYASMARGCEITSKDWKLLNAYRQWVVDNSPRLFPLTGENTLGVIGEVRRSGMECANIGPFRFVHWAKSKAMFILDVNRSKERWEHRAVMSGTLDTQEIYRYLKNVSEVSSESMAARYGRKASSPDELRAIQQVWKRPLLITPMSVRTP